MNALGGFITFEGGEGAGKSTQARLLADRLSACGLTARITREPGGSPNAERIREFILSGEARSLGPVGEAVLFSAARADHVEHLIAPALRAGEWVICDRYADSTRAYQGAGEGVGLEFVEALQIAATEGAIPDLTLLLDLPAHLGVSRAGMRRGSAQADRFEGEDLSFHERLRIAFLRLAVEEPDRFFVLDASEPIEIIHSKIWEEVVERFRLPAAVSAHTEQFP